MDQEDKELAEVLGEFKIKLREFGIGVEEREALNRAISFACRYGYREFSAFLVVNGLDRGYSKHAIEDHFLEAARHVLGDLRVEEALSTAEGDPKGAWSILKRFHRKVLEALSKSADLARRSFPQHFKAFELLLEN